MAEIRYVEEGVINAPIEQVYAFRLDLQTLPDYNPNVSNMRRIDAGADPGTGAQYLFDLSIQGFTMESPMRVIQTQAPSLIVLETGPDYMARETCSFEETDGGTKIVFDTTLSIAGEIDDTTAKQLADSGSEQVRIEIENMRKILESG